MSIIDALRCDGCGKTADRTKKENDGWRTLRYMQDAGGQRVSEHETGPHFCSIECLRDYIQGILDRQAIWGAELEPEPAAAG